MARLLLLTPRASLSTDILPALSLLPHQVSVAPLDASVLAGYEDFEILLVDARTDIAHAKAQCRMAAVLLPEVPIIAVVTEGVLVTVNSEWGIDDIVMSQAGPAEVEARLRLVRSRRPVVPAEEDVPLTTGVLVIDEHAYTARVAGRLLDLTYQEFELLKFLAQNPGRVFTRAQLLQDVWGYDYFGGTRTVDVHVRRLRAKLGHEYEDLLVTVRNVGYRFEPRGNAEAESPAQTG